jgi:hypothetical protein
MGPPPRTAKNIAKKIDKGADSMTAFSSISPNRLNETPLGKMVSDRLAIGRRTFQDNTPGPWPVD